jgi:hypothetical protein
MNLLPIDCFHVFIVFVSAVSCTLIIGKSRIFGPLRARVAEWSKPVEGAQVPLIRGALNELLNCQQCLGFWLGLFFGTVLFNPLWGGLTALCVSLFAVWNDFALLALSRVGIIRPPQPVNQTWMLAPPEARINVDPALLAQTNAENA